MVDKAAGTAVGPMVIAALERHRPARERLLDDDLAVDVLPRALRWTVSACRWGPMRNFLVKASESKAPGVWGGVLCRKRYIADRVAEAVGEGVDSVVVLGAGLDTLGQRVARSSGVAVFEVDLPVNIAIKRARLGAVADNLALVPVDFEVDDLERTLVAHGYRPDARSAFVWEGVTQYLTEAGVRRTFDLLAKAGSGSRLLFTYVVADFLDGTTGYGADALYRRFVVDEGLWTFGMDPGEVGAFLAEYGWRESEQMDAERFADRYVRPTGREVPVSGLERSVCAVKV
jgi:methyltransferase (TIGR00027 family)